MYKHITFVIEIFYTSRGVIEIKSTVFVLIVYSTLKKIGSWRNVKESVLISVHQHFSLDNEVTV